MSRPARWTALLLALAVLVLVLWRSGLLGGGGAPPVAPVLRPAPAIPNPEEVECIRYFHRLAASGERVDLPSPVPGAPQLEISVWREIGEAALAGLGPPAIDFLLDPARYEEYVAAPNLLLNTLHLLAGVPAARDAKRLPEFLARWLDPANCPPAVPGSDWPEEIRKEVFMTMRAHPAPWVIPFCEGELERTRRVYDLRGPAIDMMLRLGDVEPLKGVFATLPPTPETPDPDLRMELIQRLYSMAAPTADPGTRALVEALAPVVREAMEAPRPVERFNAMAVGLRLGWPGMAEALETFFEENREDEPAAWSALLFLAADKPDAFVREAALARVNARDEKVGFTTAVRLLMRWWPEDIVPRLLEWMRDGGPPDPYAAAPALLRYDRAAMVDWLREEVRGDDVNRLMRALVFVAGEAVTELGPAILERARELDAPLRPPLYKTLASLGTKGTEALLMAELHPTTPEVLRGAAATELLNLGSERGAARLAELVEEGDGPVLDTVFRRARVGGAAAVPEVIVAALLRALRTVPGEDRRRLILLTLRFRGRFNDVREGLVEAYRREPSRRVAKDIERAIQELAHR